ncbi:hypothetical protein THAOC_00467, partial [Thalassiosira oceanica]
RDGERDRGAAQEGGEPEDGESRGDLNLGSEVVGASPGAVTVEGAVTADGETAGEDGRKRDGASSPDCGGIRRAASRHAEAKLDEASAEEGGPGGDDGGLDDSIPCTVDRTDDEVDYGDGEGSPAGRLDPNRPVPQITTSKQNKDMAEFQNRSKPSTMEKNFSAKNTKTESEGGRRKTPTKTMLLSLMVKRVMA